MNRVHPRVRLLVLFAAITAALLWVGFPALGGDPCQMTGMGFFEPKPLTGPGAFPEDGTNTISLPFATEAGIEFALDLINDIGGPDCANSANPVLSIARYLKSTAGLQAYTGCAGVNFPLDRGVAYQVKVDTNVNYDIVGMHRPGCPITFTGPGVFPEDGTNLYSHPYHAISETASELIAEIGGALCSATGPVVSIARYIKASAGLDAYTGCAGIDFGLIDAEAYYIKVDSDVQFTPTHM